MTTTQTECEVLDQIVRCDEICEGDLVLYQDHLELVTAVLPVQNATGVEFAGFLLDGETEMRFRPAGAYIAVRRYITEGE